MVEQLTAEEVKDFFEDNGISRETAATFFQNEITGETLIHLTQDEIKEMVPKIGERAKIRLLIKKHCKVCDLFS